ncbi:hypothetical protein SAMN04515671_2949 [Nakamurella panacisegetis]|uniref:Uncharacterized protein n=1 Tax=Nakamurella panacisegetis TaxID=1090615 RepID=A0A1H0Q1T6_9ACTN|nr:hypothetical protein [Nakamurella panacisegetis]SDP10666.1 hypothetical protein SAMN04515671_2949 [Nakamurella panacisegetis]
MTPTKLAARLAFWLIAVAATLTLIDYVLPALFALFIDSGQTAALCIIFAAPLVVCVAAQLWRWFTTPTRYRAGAGR